MIGHALQDVRSHAERGKAERQIDPEDQRPVEMLGEETAEHRPADRRSREHRADIALVAAALTRGDDVGDDGLRQRHQPAPACPLHRAAEHQHGHAGGERADQRAGDENADGDQHQRAPAVNVGQLAVKRRHRGGGEQIGGDHPGEFAEVGKMPANGRQSGGDDGLVERAQKHRQHDAEHDGAHFRVRERARLNFGRCIGLGFFGPSAHARVMPRRARLGNGLQRGGGMIRCSIVTPSFRGAAKAANPESRYSIETSFWISGSRTSCVPRNDERLISRRPE